MREFWAVYDAWLDSKGVDLNQDGPPMTMERLAELDQLYKDV